MRYTRSRLKPKEERQIAQIGSKVPQYRPAVMILQTRAIPLLGWTKKTMSRKTKKRVRKYPHRTRTGRGLHGFVVCEETSSFAKLTKITFR
jgi:hypothetical protein